MIASSSSVWRCSLVLLVILPELACSDGVLRGGEPDPSGRTAATVAAPQVSFAVESFGARADGQTDSTSALQQAINAALQAGKPAEVLMGAGTYALDCASASASTTTPDWCLWVSGAKNLTIRGQGSSATRIVVRNPRKGLLWTTGSAGLALRSFSVDYDPLPFTQGTIVAVHPGENAVDVELAAGYPRLDDPRFGLQATSAGIAFGMIFEASRPRLKDGVSSCFYGQSTAPLGGNTFRVTLDPGNSRELDRIGAGDRYVVAVRLSAVLVFLNGSDVALGELAVHAGPGNATLFGAIDGAVTVDGLQVQRRPGTDRLLSTGADALHLVDCSARVSVTHCTIDGMGDDAINIYTQGNPITAVTGSATLTIQAMASKIAAGHTVQVVDLGTATVRGAATVSSYLPSADGKSATVVLDQAIAGARGGNTLYDVGLAAPGAEIRGNTFDSFRGSFRLRSSGASFTGNTLLDTANARILIDAEAVSASGKTLWNEGPSLLGAIPALEVSGNSVRGGQLSLVNAAGGTVPVAAIGTVDGIGVYTQDGALTVAGWACLQGLEVSVQVHVYVDGPYPSGSFLTAGVANAQREAAVGAACRTASARHGYFVPITAAMRASHAGKKVYLHAIDEHGNPVLHNSGVFTLP